MKYPEGFIEFVKESNLIESITDEPTTRELDIIISFVMLPTISVAELETLVAVLEPGAVLRDKPGQNVKVGRYSPPEGGPLIRKQLQSLLEDPADAYSLHIAYELLHPFADGNGRSGRALWLWQMGMKVLDRGFLRTFYTQTLDRLSALKQIDDAIADELMMAMEGF